MTESWLGECREGFDGSVFHTDHIAVCKSYMQRQWSLVGEWPARSGRRNDVRKEKNKKIQIYTIDSNSSVIIRSQEVCYE